jgi:hypothetical protein
MRKKTDYTEVNGIKFSKDVDINAIKSLGDELDPEFEASMMMPAKIRITTMVDEDIYYELKRLAEQPGAKKYQTILNDLLRMVLFPDTKLEDGLASKLKRLLPKIETMIRERDDLKEQVDKMWKAHSKKEKGKTLTKRSNHR